MTDWPAVSLQRLFRIVNGGTPTADADNWDGAVQWATPADLARVNGGYIKSTKRTITTIGLNSGSSSVPPGSLILSTRAPIGYVTETIHDTAFNQGCRGLAPLVEMDVRYFRYQFISISNQLAALGLGSTFMELSSDALAGIQLIFPPRAMQHKIADFIDGETTRIDALIAKKLNLAHLILERFRSSVDSVTQYGTPSSVGRVTSVITSGPRGWSERIGTFGFPFIRSANLRRDMLELRSDNLLRVEASNTAAEARRSKVIVGDTVIGITGANTGWVGLVGKFHSHGYVSQHVALLRPAGIVPKWLAFSMFSRHAQEQLLAGQYGGTKTQLGLEDLASLSIYVPSIEHQKLACRRLEQEAQLTRKLHDIILRQIDLLRERRQALITAAVTGQLERFNTEGDRP